MRTLKKIPFFQTHPSLPRTLLNAFQTLPVKVRKQFSLTIAIENNATNKITSNTHLQLE